MKVLIVEDDFISRKLLLSMLSHYADCDVAADGEEAVRAFRFALEEDSPYDLVFMDIMMPKMDGQEALAHIRQIEKDLERTGKKEVKVIMTTALDDPRNVFKAFHKGGATSYLIKPIDKRKLLDEIDKMGFAVGR